MRGTRLALVSALLAGIVLTLAAIGLLTRKQGAPPAQHEPPRPDASSPVPAGASTSRAADPEHREVPAAAELQRRLDAYKAWRNRANAERRAEKAALQPGQGLSVRRWKPALREALLGMKELILATPGPFIDFLKDPDNAECIPGLLQNTLYEYTRGEQCASFPDELLIGLLGTLRGGGTELRVEVLEFFRHLHGQPASFLDAYRDVLKSADGHTRRLAAHMICASDAVRADDVEYIRSLIVAEGANSDLLWSMTTVRSPEIGLWLNGWMAAHPPTHATHFVNLFVQRVMYGCEDSASINAWAESLERMSKERRDETTYWAMMQAAVYLPQSRMETILTGVGTTAAFQGTKKTAAEVLRLYHAGTTDPTVLRCLVEEAQEKARRY